MPKKNIEHLEKQGLTQHTNKDIITCLAADVAELADALASGASELRLVEVRILSSAFLFALPRF